MIALLTIAGGVALLLFGVRYLRKGLDRLFGARLTVWMNRFAATPETAFLSGLGLSIVAPSSTTMSLLAVQVVERRHLTARQMLSVMLGANIGLTVMVQLLALNVHQYAPIAILFGVIFFQFMKSMRMRGIGQVMLSLGFIFLAMDVMRRAVADGNLTTHPDFVQLMDLADGYPLVLVALATIITVLVQSSTATIGLLMGISMGGGLDVAIAVPYVIGANLGMGVTMLLVGWKHLETRRLALANMLVKGVVAAAVLAAIALLRVFSEDAAAKTSPTVIAGIHTGFNLLVAIVGLPLVSPLTRLVERMLPTPAGGRRPFGPKFIRPGPHGGLALAMGRSLREIMHVAEIVRSMIDDAWRALNTNDEPLARVVSERDDLVDQLDNAIKQYLTQLVTEEMGRADADEQMRQLRYLGELETIGDIIDKNVIELVLKKIRLGAEFSEDGGRELEDFHAKVLENFDIAVIAFNRRDRTLAHQLLRNKERLKEFERELRDRHFTRLNTGLTQSHETSAIHLDLLTHVGRINSALSHVAYAVLADPERGVDSPSVDQADS